MRGGACPRRATYCEPGANVTRRSFLTLACSVLMLSACGFQLRGQQDYAFKRLFVTGGSPAAAARLTRMVQGGSDTVVVTSPANADAVMVDSSNIVTVQTPFTKTSTTWTSRSSPG